MSVGRFDAILIDFYGTISAGDREAVESASRGIVETCGLAVSPRQFAIRWGDRFFDVIEKSNHESFRTLYECEKLSLVVTLAEFGVEADPAPLVADLEEYWLNPPVYGDVFDFFRRIDLPVCCVSNADTKPLTTAINNLNLRFDEVVTSEAVRCYKPAPGIFEQAIKALGVKPDRAIHVGDSLHSDVAGAAGLGIATVWMCRDNRVHDIGTCQPDYMMDTFAEIPKILTA
ncbi:MAG: HAD family hydrolase [Phycisphaerales bacterium]|nr:MAG: HAD family hydrolase [Phycisphaerales bacterium]